MPLSTITGEFNLTTKQVKFSNLAPIVIGENRTTLIQVSIPTEMQSYDIYFCFKDGSGEPITTPKLDINDGKAEYLLVNSALTKSGAVLFQIVATKVEGNITRVCKSMLNQQLTVSNSLDEGSFAEETPNILATVQQAINNANMAAETASGIGNQLLSDKEAGLFNGEKGDKGDPSTLDKMGAAVATIDLSDIEQGIFGTIDTPITIDETTTIQFIGLDLALGYQKSFIIYVKRTADVSVIWQDVKGWAYDEIPLLPVGQVQKILVETSNGISYYGTGGDCFNVQKL